MGMPRFPALLLAVALFVPAFGGDLRDGPLKDLNGYFPLRLRRIAPTGPAREQPFATVSR